MNKVFKFLLIVSFFIPPALHAGDRGDRLRKDVSFLCDSLSAGRSTGTRGAQNVAFYLFRQFRDSGLRTFVQSFDAMGKAGHNIYAVTPGWFKSYIVVAAYYDGLGTLDGVLYPGADSNASGVAALLELSKYLPKAAVYDTGVIFVALDGHNSGLSGASSFYSRISAEFNVLMMVNLDILGGTSAPVHASRPDYMIALGASRYRLLMDNANRKIGLDISYDYYGSRPFTDIFYKKVSDQKPFIEGGVPSVMFTSGITMDTNRQGDTPDRLDYDIFERRVTFIEMWLTNCLGVSENYIKFAGSSY